MGNLCLSEDVSNKGFVPFFAALDGFRLELFDHLVVVSRHAWIRQQEVEDAVVW